MILDVLIGIAILIALMYTIIGIAAIVIVKNSLTKAQQRKEAPVETYNSVI
jgi:uncharacterized membrane protein YuzA (DUF378 family)